MKKTRQHDIEGAILDIPRATTNRPGWSSRSILTFWSTLVDTPAGERVMLTIEDACPYAKLKEGGMRDCGSCIYYRQAPGTLLGVCGHEKNAAEDKHGESNQAIKKQPNDQNEP